MLFAPNGDGDAASVVRDRAIRVSREGDAEWGEHADRGQGDAVQAGLHEEDEKCAEHQPEGINCEDNICELIFSCGSSWASALDKNASARRPLERRRSGRRITRLARARNGIPVPVTRVLAGHRSSRSNVRYPPTAQGIPGSQLVAAEGGPAWALRPAAFGATNS